MIREASKNEILELKEVLKSKDYHSVTIISLLNVEIEFDFSRPIYVAKSDPKHFIFVPKIFSGVLSFSIYWDSEKIEKDELKLYLKSIPNWNWNKEFILSFLDTNLYMFHEMLVGEEISTNLRVSHFEISITYEIIPECLDNVTPTLPNGFVFGELQAKHIPFLFEQWKYNYTESVSSYQKLIKIFPTSAVFKDDDKRQDNPIAWVLFYSHGHIGMISTLPDYRRRGFAVAVLNNLCNKLKHKNIRLITQVNDDNEISRNFHQKIGAKMLGKSYWNIYDTIKS